MDSTEILLIARFLGFIIGLLLFYSAYGLFITLKNKEIALSMIFLHKNRAINLFGVLLLAAVLIFITGIHFVIMGGGLISDILLNLDAVALLIFTVLMNKLMKGE